MLTKRLKKGESVMNDLQVALELYTVRDETGRDFAGTLRRVAQLGYAGVEFAGYGDLTAQEMSTLLAETGLRVAGTHLGLDALQDPQLEASISYCKDIGCSIIVLPWLAKEWRTQEGLQALAPRLNAIGQRCQEQGITFGYHNHDFEFTRVRGLWGIVEHDHPQMPSLESARISLEYFR